MPDERNLFAGDGPREALRVIGELNAAGFVAYLAGGCVRDALLGREPKDFDVATNATPESVREVFGKRNTLAFGASFGVIGVLPPRDSKVSGESVEPTEVATFRSDGEYSDGRRPDSVHYGTAIEDAMRRDFTINGMFYDPSTAAVIDHVGGKTDLAERVLRTIGSPDQRLEEDKLRMLRAVRFTTTLGFEVEPATADAIRQHADAIAVVSGERIGAEMRRILTSPHAARGLRLLAEFHLHTVVMPESIDADFDAVDKYLDRLEDRDVPSALACVLIALGATRKQLSAIASRWKLTNEEVRKVAAAMKYYRKICLAHTISWDEVQPILVDRDIDTIMNVSLAVIDARNGERDGIVRCRQALRWPTERLDPPALLTGNDLSTLGFPSGPAYRVILNAVRRAQLNETIASRDEAIELARQTLESYDPE
ncbi:MAG: CCA tRNA nucleotidyltransferase [Pirellulaceae bacterium]|nr:CCA tRNA nucleotidyltransferase [Pirellulaceae bacterium]